MVYIVALLLLIALTKVVTIGGGIMDDDLSIITEQTWEEHAPINIKGNEDFKTTAQNEGWQGDGSLTNPYLIKGLNITTPSYSESVVIKNTDVHFQITNCLVKSYYRTGHCGCWHSGIYFENVSNTLILNNTINSQGGFLLSECVNISFINNKCRGIINFFEISSSKNIQIINNSISTLVSGIGILSSKNILILDNNISKIYFGDAIVLKAPEDSVILGNRIDNSTGIGINLQGGRNTSILHNIIRNCNSSGIVIHTYDRIDIIANTISNNNGTGIDLKSNYALVINNSVFNNSKGGIELRDSIKTTILGNNVSYNAWDGLFLYDTREIPISANNIVNNGGTGLILENSGEVKIIDNNVTHNHDTGVKLLNCWNNNISDNNISNNAINGILLWESTNTTVATNVIALNHEYGVYLTRQAIGNIIERNDFIQNNLNGTSQAYDEGDHNVFAYNYWDDWTEPDTNYDGIIDHPYSIDGPKNNMDLHPRARVPPIRLNVLFGLLLLGGIIVILGLRIVKQRTQKNTG